MVVDVLSECESHGMVKPLIVCVTCPNGSILAMQVSGGGVDPELLAENTKRGGLEPPLTVMVVDQTNYSFRLTVNRHGGYVVQKQLDLVSKEPASAPRSSAGFDP